jgi:phospholipase A1
MLGFLPQFFEVWEDLCLAWKGRAGKKNLSLIVTLVPLAVEKMMRKAAETAAALEARGLNLRNRSLQGLNLRGRSFLLKVKVLSVFICMFIGAHAFAQSAPARGGFFDEYLRSALLVESYETTYFMPFSVDFLDHDDRGAVEASFQISFKKDIVKNISPLGFDIGIAYTQTSWWQLYAFSNPFRETNYGPELYVNFPLQKRWDTRSGGAGLFCHGVKAAAAHKSNGWGDENNRSWNRVYLEAPISLEAPVSIERFLFIPRVWWSFTGIGNDFYEKDIPRYMGICDLTVVSRWNSHVLRVYGRSNFNHKNMKAALKVDYSYPIAATGLYFYLQYFLGYGESLIDYDRPVNKAGTGIALSR